MPGVSENRISAINISIAITGHVDAGKTSLVRALSTELSTAALDKNPQSQARGITLDLGFSAFIISLSSTRPSFNRFSRTCMFSSIFTYSHCSHCIRR